MPRFYSLPLALCLSGLAMAGVTPRLAWGERGAPTPAERTSRRLLRHKISQRMSRLLSDRASAKLLRVRGRTLASLLAPQTLAPAEQAQALATLDGIERGDATGLLGRLRATIVAQPRGSTLRRAYVRLYREVKTTAAEEPGYSVQTHRARRVIARRLLRRDRKLDGALLPQTEHLPLLPTTNTNEHFIQRWIDEALALGHDRKKIYLDLEQRLPRLRRQGAIEAKQQAELLRDYLVRYKDTDGWAERWINGLRRSRPDSRVKPNYKIVGDAFVTTKEALRLLPTPGAGFGYDERLADIKALFQQENSRPWNGPSTTPGMFMSWQLLARLQRKLIDLEASGADPGLERALGRYLNIGFRNTGLPSEIKNWPPLGPNDGDLAGTIAAAKRHVGSSSQGLYMALFGRALALAHTPSTPDRASAEGLLATKLEAYLTRTRNSIVEQYRAQIPQLQRHVLKAFAILRRVAPDLVARLPKLTFVVGAAFGPGLFTRADLPLKGRSIYLPANADLRYLLRDILHEITHTFEYHSPLSVLARALDFRAARSDGNAPVPLSSLIPGYANSGREQTGYRGDVVNPYSLRFYRDGYTEVLSTALEQLASPQAGLEFFRKDGHHLLTALGALNAASRRLATQAR